MQAAIERAFRSFSLERPVPDRRPVEHGETPDAATQLAAQLLGNYRDHLSQHSWQTQPRRQD